MFMTTVIKCHSLSYVIFNAKMTLFDLTLTLIHNKDSSNNVIFALTERMTLNDSCHKHAANLFHIHDMSCHDCEGVMSVFCTPLQVKCNPKDL